MHPKYRSRLVARQLKARDRSSGKSFFAPTHPLEALRTVMSFAASTTGAWRPCDDPRSSRGMGCRSVSPTSRGPIFTRRLTRAPTPICSFPEEDDDHMTHCAKLPRHMYRTRAAADGWQEECSSFLLEGLNV